MEELIERIKSLAGQERELFNRIFDFRAETAVQKIPPKLADQYGSAAERQELLIFTNKILHQETVFNLWRSRRPQPPQISNFPASDSFDFSPEATPEDEIGRFESTSSYTISNLAKIGVHHSLVIFRQSDPFKLTVADIVDALTIAWQWFDQVKKIDPQVKTPILFWNYLFRAGGSIYHPHLQLLYLRHLPSPLELLTKQIAGYNQQYQSQYWTDLYDLSTALGLAQTQGSLKVIVNLTPTKDRELIFLASSETGVSMGQAENWQSVFNDIAELVKKYLSLGVQSFNLFMRLNNNHQPLYALMVDRGRLDKVNCDIGALELYAFSVVGFDIVDFAKQLFR